MSGANYEYCPVCDTKALYVGEQDVPEGVVVLHQACLEKRASARDSGVRADPPGNAIDAGVAALLEANRKAGRSTNMTGYEYIIVGTILAAAAPVIAGKAARDERQAIIDLAEQHQVRYEERKLCSCGRKMPNGEPCSYVVGSPQRFADLLRGAETTGDKQ